MEWPEASLPARQPSSIAVVPKEDLFTYRDPRNEEATINRWLPVLAELGIEVLGIRDLPNEPVQVTVDGVEWELRRIGQGTYQVPPDVYHIILAAEEHNVPFAWYLWGEEQFPTPQFVPGTQGTRTAPSGPRQERRETWVERWNRKLDPILIGVIPTAPNRGVWCKLGAWFH